MCGCISFYDLNHENDKQYTDIDIVKVSEDGVYFKDLSLNYEECAKQFVYFHPLVRDYDDKSVYVGSRNSLTEPAYVRFNADWKNVYVLFSSRDAYFEFVEKIRSFGHDLFDLS